MQLFRRVNEDDLLKLSRKIHIATYFWSFLLSFSAVFFHFVKLFIAKGG